MPKNLSAFCIQMQKLFQLSDNKTFDDTIQVSWLHYKIAKNSIFEG